MFKKILIANRGEIACRIIRTCRRLGIKTVAVYSEADADALHVQMADEHVEIGPAAASESYLDIDKIITAAKRTKSEAIHPGFGFLSENAKFVKAVDKAKLVFIGPRPKAISAMGDKIESKRIAKEAGVNTVPGYIGEIEDASKAVEIAKDIGHPVMIKASAGGGGKGMRVAYTDDEVKEGFQSARNEAKSSFGDDRIFIEKFIEEPRHIEIQVLGDATGNVIYLGERECSIQRRHQKVIEEAPSPFIDAKTRKRMGEQAVALAKAVDYRSAGTVEFIVDKEKNFFFLEMNTRLQVEHPVTEMVTGLDLVEQMIRVAAGEKLAIAQKDVKLEGWSVEARIYAEDPFRGFLPSIGRITRYAEPKGNDHIRVDSGVFEGAEITMFYDPMIAKLVVHGSDRAEAIDRMQGALDSYYIHGVTHNIPFLSAVMAHPRFREGRLSTNFIAEEYPDGFDGGEATPAVLDAMRAAGIFIHALEYSRQSQVSGRIEDLQPIEGQSFAVRLDDQVTITRVEPTRTGAVVHLGGDKQIEVESAWRPGERVFTGRIDGTLTYIEIDHLDLGFRMSARGVTREVIIQSPRAAELMEFVPEKVEADTSKKLLCPMPGLVVSISVEEGEEVKAGQSLAVVEAMKMENILRAEKDATVSKVIASPGDSLAVDDTILEFE